jgi:hypothetical protein
LLNKWIEIAWNGIRFLAPVEWQLAQIDARHLLLEDHFGPTMEVKWATVKGKFSHQAHLKRLTSLQKKQIRKTVKQGPISPEWETVLTNFKASGFSWQGNATHGRGVILFCPICRNATLIQFFQKESKQSIQGVAAQVLNSFRDHRTDGQILWSAYDIRAIVPQTFQLKRHQFEAGKYEIDFADGSQQITLHRWALASILLGQQDLVQFAKTVVSFGKSEPVAGTIDGCDTVEWSVSPNSNWQWWLSRLKRKASYYWLGLWHLEEKNRILGVRAEGKKPLDTEVLDRICSNYESLSEKD